MRFDVLLVAGYHAAGVYAIRNEWTDEEYIGQTTRLAERYHEHLALLRRGDHYSQALQRAWQRFDHDAFVFTELHDLGEWDVPRAQRHERLVTLERAYLALRQPTYNIYGRSEDAHRRAVIARWQEFEANLERAEIVARERDQLYPTGIARYTAHPEIDTAADAEIGNRQHRGNR